MNDRQDSAKLNIKTPQQGISLLEILCSLAIICAILSIVVDYYYNQNKLYVTVSKATTQIQQLVNISYEWQAAQSQKDFSGLSLSTLSSAGLLTSGNDLNLDPWGGSIALSPYQGDPRYLIITLPAIPKDACLNLRNRMSTIAHQQSSESNCNGSSYFIVM